MNKWVKQVREFHVKHSQPVGTYEFKHIVEGSERQNMLDEEFSEAEDAYISLEAAEYLDALVDLIYVAIGTCIAYGWDIEEAFERVHRSNMTKDISSKPGGRVQKGDKYVAPDLGDLV